MSDIVKRVMSRMSLLQSARQLHEQVWDDCYKHTFPQRGTGLQSTVAMTASEHQRDKARIFDDTAPDGVKTGVSAFLGAAVPSNAVWAGLEVGNDTEQEKQWLEKMSIFIWQNIHSSNFDAEAFDAMSDHWVAGWSVMYLSEQPGGGYYFETWPIAQCYIASSQPGGMIDTVYRKFEYTVGQCVNTYGIEAVSQSTRDLYQDGKVDDKVELILAIEPRSTYADGGGRLAKQLPIAHYVIETRGRHTVKESGYHEFPCMCPRGMRIPASAYATGLVSDCLPSIQTLNEMVKQTLQAAELSIAPPMLVVNDGVINARNIKIGPRKNIVVSSTDSMKPLMTGAEIKTGIVIAQNLQAQIKKMLVADQMPPADGPIRTAYEWSVRVQMVRALMGPLFGRLMAEWLQPMIARAFGLAWRANEASGYQMLGEPPRSLLGRALNVKYLSPLARSQKQAEVDAMDGFEANLLQTAGAMGDMSILDVYDVEQAKRERATLTAIPQKLMRDKKVVDQIRQQRAEAQQAAQQQALQAQGQAETQTAMAQRLSKAQ